MAKKIYSDSQVLGSVSATSLEVTGEYSLPTTDGTPNYVLATDGAGNVSFIDVNTIVTGGGGGVYTSNNGITLTGSTFKLGGTLLANTTIAASTYNLAITGSRSVGTSVVNISNTLDGPALSVTGVTTLGNPGVISVQNTSTGAAIRAAANLGGIAIYGETTTVYGGYFTASGIGTGIFGRSTGGVGVEGLSNSKAGGKFTTSLTSVNEVKPAARFDRLTTGTAAAGIGISNDFHIMDSGGGSTFAGRIAFSYTDPTPATLTSSFEIQTINQNSQQTTRFTIQGNGQIKFNNYGTGANTGTPTRHLAVTSNGTVIEVAGTASGTFTSQDGKIITVTNGLITSIV